MFKLIDIIASHQWGNDEIGDRLLRLSSSMTDEVELLSGLHDRDLSPTSVGRRAA
jgi:hypothetical protein